MWLVALPIWMPYPWLFQAATKSRVDVEALISATSTVVDPAVRLLFFVTLPMSVVELPE